MRLIAEAYNSNRTLGIPLGEFDLPSTGGWQTFNTVTFPIPANFEFNYLRNVVPLRMEFVNPLTPDYLFDVASFKISNASNSPPFTYNKRISALLYSIESNPGDDGKVRSMSNKVGYIKHGTSITFDDFVIPNTSPNSNIPKSITITYTSGGAGGTMKVVSDALNSSRVPGVTLGEFALPNTGGWEALRQVTFPITYDFELNYLRFAPPLRLEFNNPGNPGAYLFDIVDFTINN